MIYPVRLDDEHRYWVPGARTEERRPGFSEIALDLGISKPNPFYTDEGKEEGKALHLWLNFLARGKTPKAKPDPRIAGRVEGIKKFIKDTKFEILGGEVPLYDPINRSCCTPDMWGMIRAFLWVIDAKRGAKLKAHRLQTAAQSIALRANGVRVDKRGALYLRDEDYRLDEHVGSQDERRWTQIVSTYHIKQEYI
jgi:hypothetical protein